MTETSLGIADGHEPYPNSASVAPFTRQLIDAALLKVFHSKAIRRSLKDQQKLSLPELGARALREIEAELCSMDAIGVEALTVHRRLVEGLPGQALFVAAALAFETLSEALPFFGMTSKTAWHKLESLLSSGQSEQALRLGRAAVMASEIMGSTEGARRYLHTSNFALGGVTALELLRTAEGEHLVLTELQTQAYGGPV